MMATQGKTRSRQPRMPIEVRREQVLDAALRLISERGYGAATMEQIAREASIAKPVVYNAYPGRGSLLKALLEREEQRGLHDLGLALATLARDVDPDAALVNAFRTFLESVGARPVTWRLILLPADETPQEVRQHVDAGRALALDGIRSLVQSGAARRAGLRGADVELLAHAMLGLCEQAARLVLLEPDKFTPDRYATFAAWLLNLMPAASRG